MICQVLFLVLENEANKMLNLRELLFQSNCNKDSSLC